MKNPVKMSLVVLVLISFATNLVAQSDLNIGVIPIYSPGSSQRILFVDADKGEIKSFTNIDEPISNLSINNKEGVFYLLSRHNMYKGDLNSGEIIDKFQHTDVIEQKSDDILDPNSNIMPYGVSEDGYAIIQYNSELEEISRQQTEVIERMGSASMSEINTLNKKNDELTTKMTILINSQELYLVDFNSKSKKLYGKFNMEENRYLGIDGKLVKFYNPKKQVVSYRNILDQEVVNERSISGLFEQYPNLRNVNNPSVREVSENIIYYAYFNMSSGGTYYLYNTETNNVILKKEFPSAAQMNYPLLYFNTTYYSLAELSCNIGPMPSIPEFPEFSGKPKKKLIAAYEAKLDSIQNAHQKALNEWSEKATNPQKSCGINILDKDDLTKVKMVIPNTSMAFIYNDKYALVNRNFEVALYNIDTNEQLWVIDTDF